MPVNTEKSRKKREAVRGVVWFLLLQAACIIGFCSLCLIPGLPRWLVILFGVLAALCIAPMVGALVALKQRFKEIEGGELYDAGKY